MSDQPLDCSPAPFWTTWRKALFVALLAVCMFTRLYDIGQKAIMHDEALFVYYTEYQLHREFNYFYQPILHGPLFLYIQAIVFHVFGVSDYTMRLGNGLVGVACFLVIARMRKWFGEYGFWAALALFTLSPGLMFYERFFRNDSLFTMLTLLMSLSAAQWWNTRRAGWAACFILCAVSAFCNMETSIIYYFSGFTFFLLLGVHDVTTWVIRGRDNSVPEQVPDGEAPRFPSAVVCALVVGGFITLCLTNVFEGIKYDGDVVAALNKDWALRDVRSIPLALGWSSIPIGNPKDAGPLASPALWRASYIALFAGLAAVFFVVRLFVENVWGRREFLARFWHSVLAARWWILGAMGAGLALYIAAFTTFFVHPLGPFQIYKNTFGYWAGQNDWHRIKGPFHYHLVNTLIYELPACLILVGAWLAGIMRMRWNRATVIGLLLTLPVCLVFDRLLFAHLDGARPDWFRVLGFGVILLSALLFVQPRLGRVWFPLAILAFTIYSVVFFNSEAWNTFFDKPVLVAGEQVAAKGMELLDRKITVTSGMHLYVIMFLVFIGTVLSWHAIDKNEKFHAWLIWWTITAIGAYCYAREKVPWVAMHMFTPIVLLSASYIQKLFAGTPKRWHRVWLGLAAAAALWQGKAAFNLSFRNYDSVRERMVYSHTPHDLKNHAELIVRYYGAGAPIAMDQPSGTNAPGHIREFNNPPKIKDCKVLVKGESIWAFRWYLRDIDWTEYVDVQAAINSKYPFIILDSGDESKYPELKKQYNIVRSRCRMFWTPLVVDFPKLADAWKLTIPGHYLDNSPQAGEAFQAKQEWGKLWDYMIYRKTFDGAGQFYPAISTVDYIFCSRKDLPPF